MTSRKITAIAAGEAHTLALTADGGVFSWGRGNFGRLGTGKDQDELVPVRVAADAGDRRPATAKFVAVAVAAGAYHSLALEDDGSVWSWGYNTYGQLGHGEENSSVPCLVQCFQELGSSDLLADESNTEHAAEPLKFSSVKAGGMTSLAIDSLGALWMWGNCPQATASGEFSLESSTTPLPIRGFNDHIVVKVACGNEHIIAAVSAGERHTGGVLVCYAWGTNNHGQLGLGDNKSRPHPQVIPTFNQESPWAVYEIACGAFHTALLTHEKSNSRESESKCWTFGLGENGQLGHGTSRSKYTPETVNGLPEDAVLISVDCGLFHTSIVSAAGEVWSWGMEKGLGLCPDACFTGNDAGDALSPLRIQSTEANGFRFPGPVQVACGAAHTVLVADDGYKLWAWGRGRNGVLGTGQTSDSFVPRAAVWSPLDDDSLKEGVGTSGEDIDKDGLPEETDQRLSTALKEISLLQRKLTLMERYATVLHVSIFRKPLDERSLPQSLQDSGVFDIRKELESMVESAKTEDLAQMEMFYRGMLSNVKDKMLKRRIQEIVKESLGSMSTGRQYQY